MINPFKTLWQSIQQSDNQPFMDQISVMDNSLRQRDIVILQQTMDLKDLREKKDQEISGLKNQIINLLNKTNEKEPISQGALSYASVNAIFKKYNIKANLSDNYFNICTVDDAKVYVEASGVQYRKWIEENHDCDNFSLALLGYWSEGLYSFAFGYARSKTHAFNVMINEKMELWICEPQDNKWYQYDFFLKINSEQYKITEVLM